MANFKTHISVAAIASGLLATVCLGAGLATPQEVVIFSVIGTLGGILPDIDLNHSSPTKIIFTSLAIIFAFLVMFNRADTYSILELWLVWGLSYAAVRYLAWQMFTQFTIHRGIIHSIACALFFWFLTTTLCYYLFDFSKVSSWMTGFFIFFGFVVHLLLDELYSVDFMNHRLKNSFGTALKIIDYKNYQTSTLMIIAAMITFYMTPSADSFIALLADSHTYQDVIHNFLPQGLWFQM